jgi:hypothetical protein
MASQGVFPGTCAGTQAVCIGLNMYGMLNEFYTAFHNYVPQ